MNKDRDMEELFGSIKPVEQVSFDSIAHFEDQTDIPQEELALEIMEQLMEAIADSEAVYEAYPDALIGESIVKELLESVRGVLDVLTTDDIGEIADILQTNEMASKANFARLMNPDSANTIGMFALLAESRITNIYSNYETEEDPSDTEDTRPKTNPSSVFDFEESQPNDNEKDLATRTIKSLRSMKIKFFTPEIPTTIVSNDGTGGSAPEHPSPEKMELGMLATGILPLPERLRDFVGVRPSDSLDTQYERVVQDTIRIDKLIAKNSNELLDEQERQS